jgi:hypothetical protein
MIKHPAELVPGDAINLGRGYAVVSAVRDVGRGIAVLLDCGDAAVLDYDVSLHVAYNVDEERAKSARAALVLPEEPG